MTIVKHKTNGSYLIVDVVASQLVQRVYYGYTKKEAVAKFKRESKEERR